MEEEIKGIRFTKQGMEFWAENPEQREHPAEGSFYYWLGAKLAQFDEEDDCDITFLNKGYATAVPIHIGDLTHHLSINQQREKFENYVNTKVSK